MKTAFYCLCLAAICCFVVSCSATSPDPAALTAQIETSRSALASLQNDSVNKLAAASADLSAARIAAAGATDAATRAQFDTRAATDQAKIATEQAKQDALAKIDTAAIAAKTAIQALAGDTKAAQTTATTVGSFIPGPWGPLATLAIPLLIGGIQQLRVNKWSATAQSLGDAVQSIRTESGVTGVDKAMVAAVPVLTDHAYDVLNNATAGALDRAATAHTS